MNSIILAGSSQKALEYIENFKKENNIPDYFITVSEDLKISESRNIQRLVSQKIGQNEKRLFVISNPTIEAQNSLLKTLEELPESVFIIFKVNSRDDLLSTVISRSKIIYLEETRESANTETQEQNIEEILNNILNKTDIELSDISGLILALRKTLRENIYRGEEEKIEKHLKALKKLQNNFKLAKTNNINKRLLLENSIN